MVIELNRCTEKVLGFELYILYTYNKNNFKSNQMTQQRFT